VIGYRFVFARLRALICTSLWLCLSRFALRQSQSDLPAPTAAAATAAAAEAAASTEATSPEAAAAAAGGDAVVDAAVHGVQAAVHGVDEHQGVESVEGAAVACIPDRRWDDHAFKILCPLVSDVQNVGVGQDDVKISRVFIHQDTDPVGFGIFNEVPEAVDFAEPGLSQGRAVVESGDKEHKRQCHGIAQEGRPGDALSRVDGAAPSAEDQGSQDEDNHLDEGLVRNGLADFVEQEQGEGAKYGVQDDPVTDDYDAGGQVGHAVAHDEQLHDGQGDEDPFEDEVCVAEDPALRRCKAVFELAAAV